MRPHPTPPGAGPRARTGARALAATLTLVASFVSRTPPAEAEFLDNVSDHVLATNGLKVVLVENHRAPVVTFQVWYRVGSRNEQIGRTGLAHLFEHMMFKGTKTRGAEDFSRIVQENGGNDNAFTGKDYTAYFENIVSERAPVVIELEADRLANLLLREGDFEPERRVVMEERRMRTEDEPNSVLFEETEAVALAGHPYGWPVIGWMSDLERIRLEDLTRFRKTFYSPANAVVVVAGDFRPDEMLATIRKHFGRIPRGPDPGPAGGGSVPQSGERRVTVEKRAEIPFLVMAYRAPNHESPECFALEVLAHVLASGESSRLYRSLVHEKRLALDVGVSYDLVSHDPELFTFSAQVPPGKPTADVEAAIEEEIERVKKEAVGEAELAKAKNQIEAHFVYAQDSLFYQAMTLARWEVAGGGWMKIRDYLPGIRKVTAADLQAAARRYLVPASRTVGVLVPLPIDKGGEDELSGHPAGHPGAAGTGVAR